MLKKHVEFLVLRDNMQMLGYLQDITVCDKAFGTQHAGHTCKIKENSMTSLLK